MLEELKKSVDKGVDFAFATGEKIAKAAKEMAKENKLTKEEAKHLLDYLVKKSEETRATIEKELQEVVKTSLKKMNIPTKDDVKKLEDRIKKLEGRKRAPAKAKAKPALATVAKPKAK